MLRMVFAQLRRRGGRTVALGLAILVAALGFTVLTASSEASQLETVGTVRAHARTVYDILVRPQGARSAAETSQGLVAPGLLSSTTGGISLEQWHQIQAVPGVDVAAPIAVLGYMSPRTQVGVNTHQGGTRQASTVRVDATWADAGSRQRSANPHYSYVSVQAAGGGGTAPPENSPCGPGTDVSSPGGLAPGSTVVTVPSSVDCSWSPSDVGDAGAVRFGVTYPFPLLLVAVDPTAESQLDGLDHASSAAALSALSGPAKSSSSFGVLVQEVPVLMAARSPVAGSVTLTARRLPDRANQLIVAGKPLADLGGLSGPLVARQTFTAEQVYQQMRPALSSFNGGPSGPGFTTQYWSAGPASLMAGPGGVLHARPTTNDLSKLWVDRSTFSVAPVGSDDTQFRALTLHQDGSGSITSAASLTRVGDFDPARLTGLGDVTARILAGWDTVPTVGADAASRAALHDRPVAPSTNMGALVAPPPLMVTSISAMGPLIGGDWQPSGQSATPISAVRVRVKDVTGFDATSRARVRLAAQRIQQATGLAVDVTVGSSATTKTISEPAGRFGRPALLLAQPWVKKGVATAIIAAVDKKSLILFLLVLVVSALSVANSAIAAVRGRRTELGVLAAVGWRRRHLFTIVAAELALVAVAAGVVAGAAALVLGSAIGTPVGLGRAALAVPAALLVALAAGIAPAWMASRAEPMAAVQPAVNTPRKASRLRSVTGMGRANATRHRARTLLTGLGLLIGVAAFTMLLAITLGYQGAVVGTLLGDAVEVQARGADYAAVAATLVLAGLGVANVLYLNIRDRGPELATLRAVGWERGHLNRMVITEGLVIAAVGAVPGAVLGIAGAWALTGSITTAVLAAAALAVAIAFAVVATAAVLSTRLVHRLPTTVLLTE